MKRIMFRLLKLKPLCFLISNRFINCLELVMVVVIAVRDWRQRRKSLPRKEA